MSRMGLAAVLLLGSLICTIAIGGMTLGLVHLLGNLWGGLLSVAVSTTVLAFFIALGARRPRL